MLLDATSARRGGFSRRPSFQWLKPPVQAGAFCLAILYGAIAASAQDFTGVQPVALDQPRIYAQLRRSPGSPALVAKSQGQSTSTIECYLDTGASSVVFSANTAKAMGLPYQRTAAGTPVKYEDIGVAGNETFGVSEPLYGSVATYPNGSDGNDAADYSNPIGPYRCELRASSSLLEVITGDLDVIGMPLIQHHVIVMDVRAVNNVTDKIKTSLVAPNSRLIPPVDERVPLKLVSFSNFTKIIPAAAQGPEISPNPIIGLDPLGVLATGPTPLAQFHGKSAKISMLLDTGSVSSMISRRVAAELGVTYSADESTLVGVPADQQFSLDIGGIGGQKTSRGFYLDCLQIPTDSKRPLRYFKAPVLVSDITVSNPQTKQSFTLDGVFGMNYLVASAAITGGLVPDIGNIQQGPYSFLYIDMEKGVLGLQNAKQK
ncbi:MAG TPA: hypothetical protein VGG19_20845 [Tepidisphaeraceae bacterium]|jgi:hypothetical protein